MTEFLDWLQGLIGTLVGWLGDLATPYKGGILALLAFGAVMYLIEHHDDDDEDSR